MSDFLKGLTPAPWKSSGIVPSLTGEFSIVIESADAHYIARMFTPDGPWGCNSQAPDEAAAKANAEFIALARNAEGILVKRGWGIGFNAQEGPLQGWYVQLPNEMFPLDRCYYPLTNLRAPHPYLVVVEGDKLMKEIEANVEATPK